MILSETDFFQGIESEVMTKITAVSKEEEHPKDTVLFNKDDLDEIFDQRPDVGLKILKRLGAVFSKRLNRAYRDLLSGAWSEPL